jgi:hypothetical protein
VLKLTSNIKLKSVTLDTTNLDISKNGKNAEVEISANGNYGIYAISELTGKTWFKTITVDSFKDASSSLSIDNGDTLTSDYTDTDTKLAQTDLTNSNSYIVILLVSLIAITLITVFIVLYTRKRGVNNEKSV